MKTTLTSLQKDLYKFTSLSGIRPALNAVLFNGVRAVATDSFRLVEVTKTSTIDEAIPDILIKRDSLKNIKTSKTDKAVEVETVNGYLMAAPTTADGKRSVNYVLETVSTDEFPRYQIVKDAQEALEHVEINICGDYLAEIVAHLAKFNPGGIGNDRNSIKSAIKIRVPKDKNNAMIIEAESATERAYAILMPTRV